MNLPIHSRKTSIVDPLPRLQSPDAQREIQTGWFHSLKETPKGHSYFWKNRTNKCIAEKNGGADNSKGKLMKSVSSKNINRRGSVGGVNLHEGRLLQNISNIILESALYIVKAAIQSFSQVYSQSKFSAFAIKNCYVDKNNKLLISHQRPHSHQSVQLLDEAVIVKSIIEGIAKLNVSKSYDDFYFYYKRASIKNKCDFKYTLSLIFSYCKCSKIMIADRIYTFPKQRFSAKRAKLQIKSSENITSFKQIGMKGYNGKSCTSIKNIKSLKKVSFTSKIGKNDLQLDTSTVEKLQNIKISCLEGAKNILESDVKPYENPSIHMTTKQSTTSTNFNSSQNQIQSIQASSNTFNSKILCISQKIQMSKASQNKPFLFLPSDLEQVQSIGESSQIQDTRFPGRNFQTPRDIQKQNAKKLKQNEIIENNQWTRKIQGLFCHQTQLNSSLINRRVILNLRHKISRSEFLNPKGHIKIKRKEAKIKRNN